MGSKRDNAKRPTAAVGVPRAVIRLVMTGFAVGAVVGYIATVPVRFVMLDIGGAGQTPSRTV